MEEFSSQKAKKVSSSLQSHDSFSPPSHNDAKLHQVNIDSSTNQVAKQIVDAAIKVHRALGPGLLESIYEACLSHELIKRGFKVHSLVQLPINFEGLVIQGALRLDLLVQDSVIVELKAVELILPVHHAQLLSYLRLASKRLGLLLNFNGPLMKHGIKRLIL